MSHRDYSSSLAENKNMWTVCCAALDNDLMLVWPEWPPDFAFIYWKLTFFLLFSEFELTVDQFNCLKFCCATGWKSVTASQRWGAPAVLPSWRPSSASSSSSSPNCLQHRLFLKREKHTPAFCPRVAHQSRPALLLDSHTFHTFVFMRERINVRQTGAAHPQFVMPLLCIFRKHFFPSYIKKKKKKLYFFIKHTWIFSQWEEVGHSTARSRLQCLQNAHVCFKDVWQENNFSCFKTLKEMLTVQQIRIEQDLENLFATNSIFFCCYLKIKRLHCSLQNPSLYLITNPVFQNKSWSCWRATNN